MKSVKITACNCEQIKEKDVSSYMTKGFKYFDATIKSNVFTLVGKRVL